MIEVAYNVKQYFFDRKLVLEKVAAGRVRLLSRLGAHIRQRARSSMKKAPAEHLEPGKKRRKNARSTYSPPGKPPYRRIGLLYDFLAFFYDPHAESVVIGPRRARKGIVPGLMERGGIVRISGRRLSYEARPYMLPAYEAELRLIPSELKALI